MASRKVISGEADSITAIAHELDVAIALTAVGSKLLSIKNATTEKFVIDKDGNLRLMIIEGTIGTNAYGGRLATIKF